MHTGEAVNNEFVTVYISDKSTIAKVTNNFSIMRSFRKVSMFCWRTSTKNCTATNYSSTFFFMP